MEKVEQSTFAKVKKVLVLAKTAFIIFQTVKAAIAWRRSKKPMGVPAQFLLLFSAVIVALGCAYKFTSKEIKPLVTLQSCSHYLAFCIMHVLLGYVECRKFEARDKILRCFYLFHVMFWGLIVFSYKTATCTKENFYPDAFLLNNCFFVGIYVMVYMLHSKGYTLEWGKDEEAAKKLFTAQTDRYLSFFTFLVQLHVLEVVLGKGMDTFTDAIMCSADGKNWIFNSGKGNLFMMLHIIGTMMGAGMARAVFIKTAKAEGFFGGVDEDSDDEDDSKDSKKKVAEEPKKTK